MPRWAESRDECGTCGAQLMNDNPCLCIQGMAHIEICFGTPTQQMSASGK